MEQTQKQGGLIPFGKYKGQPIEVLQHDQQYIDWLMGQDWFRTKYQMVYNVIVNNFGEPAETPEHNQMQVKFLQLDWRLKLCLLLDKELFAYSDTYFKEALQRFFKNQDTVTLKIVNAVKDRIAGLERVIAEHESELPQSDECSSISLFSAIGRIPDQEVEFTYQIPPSPFEERRRTEYHYKNRGYGRDDPREILKEITHDFIAFKQYLYEVYHKLKEILYIDSAVQFEDSGFDVCYRLTVGSSIDLVYFSEKVRKLFEKASPKRYNHVSEETTEHSMLAERAWHFELSKCRGGVFYVELKPSMGDDFPAVLRQIKMNKKQVKEHYRYHDFRPTLLLVIGTYTGQGATFEEVKALFKTENINVVLEQEVEDVQLPEYRKKLTHEFLDLPELQESLKMINEITCCKEDEQG